MAEKYCTPLQEADAIADQRLKRLDGEGTLWSRFLMWFHKRQALQELEQEYGEVVAMYLEAREIVTRYSCKKLFETLTAQEIKQLQRANTIQQSLEEDFATYRFLKHQLESLSQPPVNMQTDELDGSQLPDVL